MTADDLDGLAEECLQDKPGPLQTYRDARAAGFDPLSRSSDVVKFLSRGLNEREARCAANS